ncbi:MAG: T9SS type A sorting domain-containing protein, partial [Phycisphaerae bacterium]|nr:T9SS type A sorting domain-containing protein [Phycisphaerae bacterium]
TNDHGRHDDQHGGFSGHGDGCEGCRHIMFLALGPEIKQNYVSHQYHRIPDMAVTASDLLGINPEYATGQVMTEMIQSNPIEEPDSKHPLATFSLAQNYPNPFNPSTNVEFEIRKAEWVRLAVYDNAGRKVAMLVNEKLSPGSYKVQWEGRDDAGREVSSGVYYYQITAGAFSAVKKCVLLK